MEVRTVSGGKIWSNTVCHIAQDKIVEPISDVQDFVVDYQQQQINAFGQVTAINVVERLDGKFDLLAAFARYKAVKRMGLDALCIVGCEPATNAVIMMNQGFRL